MTEFYIWQVIRLGNENAPQKIPVRVLEEGPVIKDEVTEEFARELLQDRCSRPSYRVHAGLKVRPEAVRVLDESGQEVLSYSVIDLRRDGGTISPSKADDESGTEA